MTGRLSSRPWWGDASVDGPKNGENPLLASATLGRPRCTGAADE